MTFVKHLTLNPKSDNSHVGMGVVCRKQDDLVGARAAYGEAIRLVPDNAQAKRLGYHSPEALEEIFDDTRTID